MSEAYKIAIVGAGPGGLSAAARAAGLGISHVLLESEPALAGTIRRFQKGKHVMAEPGLFPLRSDLGFSAGTRESVLDQWEASVKSKRINLQLNARVVSITGGQGDFALTLASGETVRAEFIILAVGLQSNIRKLEISGADHPKVQYQLDDPEEYSDETIVVVGGGDAGVENALALKERNHVILINRQEDFINCRDENFDRIIAALRNAEIECHLDTVLSGIETMENEDFPLTVAADTPQGVEKIACHRVIARLGAEPPRRILEGFGIRFQSEDNAALPLLTAHAESSIPGLYIVGALAGYPLIKQAINHGYDVVECILGHPVESLDQSLIKQKLVQCCPSENIEEGLAGLQTMVPLFSNLSSQQMRELLLASSIRHYEAGDAIFERNDYSTSFFSLVDGEVGVYVNDDTTADATLVSGQFFGEMGLISGRRRSATILAHTPCRMIETPRRMMLKLIEACEPLRRTLDEAALKRAIHSYLGLALSPEELDRLVHHAELRRFAAGEVLFHEGDQADGLHLIRRGSVTVSRLIAGREYTLSYVAAGNYLGEMALLSGKPRSATVRAAVNTETILLGSGYVASLIEQNPALRSQLDERYMRNVESTEIEHAVPDSVGPTSSKPANLIAFLTQQGIGEATDVLLIDYSKCIRCDNCESACADTHGGTSRLDREAGPTYANVHVPTSCRHCEHPHCMKECPPDALHRSVNGEVFITDQCIGCGQCVSNCPYGVIQLSVAKPTSRQKNMLGFLLELATGYQGSHDANRAKTPQQAVKCDMCKGFRDGPVCIRACPTGAALRVTPEDFLHYARQLGAETMQS